MPVPDSGQVLPSGRRGGAWTSALSTGEFAVLRSVGFEPVGQVMGSAVFHIGRSGRYWGYHDCLAMRSYAWPQSGAAPDVALSGRGAPSRALVGVLNDARRTALDRMAAECRALGGDGTVSATLTMAPFVGQANCFEFKVVGTAVRAEGVTRNTGQPFSCHTDGEGFAKLVGAGWVPVGLLVGMSIGVRHDDYRTVSQRSSWRNAEVTGWTDLVQAVRSDARQHLLAQGVRHGGDGIVMASNDLRVWREPCIRYSGNDQEDHIVEATTVGTAVARFQVRRPPPPTVAVLPLGDRAAGWRRAMAAGRAPGPGNVPNRRVDEGY